MHDAIPIRKQVHKSPTLVSQKQLFLGLHVLPLEKAHKLLLESKLGKTSCFNETGKG